MIATIPDYVDSNSGWMADEVLGAIQAAMGRANFVLDRFRLIDWLPADESHPDRVNESKQHERQPGALVFRKVRPNAANSGKQIRLQVVLLVLETPTAGVHRVALKNAMTFVSRWNDAMRVAMEPATDEERSPIPHGEQSPILRLVAPVFSGSMPSLALELRNWKDPSAVKLITGSAMADVNATVVERFAPGVTYQATVQPTSAIMGDVAKLTFRVEHGHDGMGWIFAERVADAEESRAEGPAGGRRERLVGSPLEHDAEPLVATIREAVVGGRIAPPGVELLRQRGVSGRVFQRGLVRTDRERGVSFVVSDLAEEDRRGRQRRPKLECPLEARHCFRLPALSVGDAGRAQENDRVVRRQFESISEVGGCATEIARAQVLPARVVQLRYRGLRMDANPAQHDSCRRRERLTPVHARQVGKSRAPRSAQDSVRPRAFDDGFENARTFFVRMEKAGGFRTSWGGRREVERWASGFACRDALALLELFR